MSDEVTIVLMGPRACGKTTVGRALAARLGRRFFDLDQVALAEFAQPTIADVWSSYGEPAWRAAESRTLHRLLNEARIAIIALGGGTPMIEAVQRHLAQAQSRGEVRLAYLHCPPSTLQRRLREVHAGGAAAKAARPPLMGRDAIEEVAVVLAAREPTYRRLADVIVNADDDPERVVDALEGALRGMEPRISADERG